MKPVGGLFLLLLIGVGLYLYLSAQSAQTTLTAAKPAKQAVVEITGQDVRGSFLATPVEKDGRLAGLEVKQLVPQSAMATMYDLQVGDVIVQVGPFGVKDTDADSLQAQLAEAGYRQHRLTVLRNGQRLELDNHGAAAELGGKTRGTPANPLQGLGIGTH